MHFLDNMVVFLAYIYYFFDSMGAVFVFTLLLMTLRNNLLRARARIARA